ncbi:glycosyl hydrolase, partial [bacterium]
FQGQPQAKYADYYERALYNHILASINPSHPGYVYFTPIRPGHYRVYSQPGQGFWCCVGTGMENPGLYGKLVYAKAKDGVYVNLFVPSELKDGDLTLRQTTKFPDESRTGLTLKLKRPTRMTLYLRHPAWVSKGFAIKVNGKPFHIQSSPSSYAAVTRTWKTGDRVEVALPMRTTVERLPDGSDWVSILRGPIVLATPTGTQDQPGLLAGAGRGDHIAHGPLVPLDRMPALLTSPEELPRHVVRDPSGLPMRFRLMDVAVPDAGAEGLSLMPFYRLQESRYQMVWNVTTKEKIAAQRARLAEEERAKLARDAATIDRVAVGEQQPEVDHQMTGDGLETGTYNGRRWRHGRTIQYTLNLHGEQAADLEVTYSGDDAGRTFGLYVGDVLVATQELKGEKRGGFFEVRYGLSAAALATAENGRLTVRFVG